MQIPSTIIDRLFEIEAVKFGEFKLKSGIISPFYIDLRLIISYPDLLKDVSELVWTKARSLKMDVLCGVPYTALPIATCISVAHNIPMIMKRKEVKDYGTKKVIEGIFKTDDTCLVVEDIITSGASIIETVEPLAEHSLKVNDVIVIIDRQQGGVQNVEKHGFHVHSLFTITEIMDHLLKKNKISEKQVELTHAFIEGNNVTV